MLLRVILESLCCVIMFKSKMIVFFIVSCEFGNNFLFDLFWFLVIVDIVFCMLFNFFNLSNLVWLKKLLLFEFKSLIGIWWLLVLILLLILLLVLLVFFLCGIMFYYFNLLVNISRVNRIYVVNLC